MVMDINAVEQNAYGRVSELQGRNTHGAVAVRDSKSEAEAQLAGGRKDHNDVRDEGQNRVTSKGLTDGKEVTLVGVKPRENNSVKSAEAAKVYAKGAHVGAEDGKSEAGQAQNKDEQQFETVGVKPKAIPEGDDPNTLLHSRIARDILDAAETRQKELQDKRVQTERRALNIVRDPKSYGFPVDV